MSRRFIFHAAFPLLVACAVAGCGGDKDAEKGRAQLLERVAAQLEAANARANAYDFDAAKVILRDLSEQVAESPFADTTTYDKLTAELQAVRCTVFDRESDYQAKIRAGWKLVDAKLVSPEERARSLAEKKRLEAAERAEWEAKEARRAADAKALRDAPASEEARRNAAREEAERQRAEARRLREEATELLTREYDKFADTTSVVGPETTLNFTGEGRGGTHFLGIAGQHEGHTPVSPGPIAILVSRVGRGWLYLREQYELELVILADETRINCPCVRFDSDVLDGGGCYEMAAFVLLPNDAQTVIAADSVEMKLGMNEFTLSGAQQRILRAVYLYLNPD